jgi:hypothetical protein
MQLGSPDPLLEPLVNSFLHQMKGLLHPVSFDASFFSSLLSRVDVVLVSGSDETMQCVLPLVTQIPSLLIPTMPRARHDSATLALFGVKVLKIKHCLVGGATNGSVPLGFLGCSLAGFKSPFRRHLRHVLDFAVPPEACPALPSFPHYPATGALRLTELELPVVYKSPHFCRTGWGARPLNLKEFACSFDFPSPSHASMDELSIFAVLFPLKLLEAPLQHVFESLPSDTSVATSLPLSSLSSLGPLTSAPASGKTWLPLIGKFLPDSWSDETLISDKAAKADAAPVPCHLWDKQSTLVFPQLTAAALAGFRSLAIVWQRRYMATQLRFYLKLKHGADWLPRLLRVRLASKVLATSALDSQEPDPPPRKRVRQGVFPPKMISCCT